MHGILQFVTPHLKPLETDARVIRRREITRIQKTLERLHSPRLQMMVIVALTGAVGFLASFVLLNLGVNSLWFRYFLAVAIAYSGFLLLLWCWLRQRDDLFDHLDILSPDIVPGGKSGTPDILWEGAGGKSGGGGATGIFERPEVVPLSSSPATDSKSIASGGAGMFDLEDLAIILVALVALVSAAGAAFWIVWGAPILFAELVLDAALAAGLYRRLRGVSGNHWLGTAVRRTGLLFLGVAVLFAVAGAAMQYYSPGAKSIGQVFQDDN
jgi:hypothetical protein